MKIILKNETVIIKSLGINVMTEFGNTRSKSGFFVCFADCVSQYNLGN